MRTLSVPGDKSLTHRALILGALAAGESVVRGALDGADTRSTAAVLRALGCDVAPFAAEMRIRGIGLRGFRAPTDVLDCGNSGTTARLLMGVLAAQSFTAELTGDASLRSRPMRRVTTPLEQMGARFTELGEPDRLPLRVHGGALSSIDYESPHASAQVKSAILLAGLCAGVRVAVREPAPSRDHTERMLDFLGAPLVRADGWVELHPVAALDPLDFPVPGDFSSAAFLIAFGLLAAREPLRIRGVGVNPLRTGFLNVVWRMGAQISVVNARTSCGEGMADIEVRPSALRGTTIAPAEIPSQVDEVPILAVLAAHAAGETRIEGAGELRVKESDRISAMVSNLRAVGVIAEELHDGLVVQGSDAPLRGRVQALHDHRIAMAFGVAGAVPGNDIEIDDRAIADVSFPGFWNLLHELSP